MGSPIVWVVLAVAGYLVGSIPFGLLIGLARGVDVRQHGSGNIGATNVTRTLGKKVGALCFALDVLKGAIPALVMTSVFSGWCPTCDGPIPPWYYAGAVMAPVIGHMYPVWLRFRGGKGVATACGVLLGMSPWMLIPFAVVAGVWIVSAAITRMVGISSCLAALALPVAAWIDLPREGLPIVVMCAALAALVIWKHRGNLRRTFDGTEPRIGAKRAASVSAPIVEAEEEE